MTAHPSSYNGWDEPYAFVAYSHSDSATVYEDISWLQERGQNIAYDEGISPGGAWSDVIAERIQACSCFIFFLSKDSVVSEHCRRELGFALEEERTILAIHLDETIAPAGVRLSLNNRQAILRFSLSSESYRAKLLDGLLRSETNPTSWEPVSIETDRYHIGIDANGEPGKLCRRLSTSLLRYISWQGGVFRAKDHQHNATADYLIRLDLDQLTAGYSINWEVVRNDSGNVIWASSTTDRNLEEKCNQIAESVGQGALNKISEHEYQRCSKLTLDSLTYRQLIVRAETLNYLNRAELSDRISALRRATEVEPGSGLPHARLAGLLSWQIINGIAGDGYETTQELLDEARTALHLDGGDPSVLLSVGTTYCRIQRYEDGLSLIRRSFRMAPTMAAKDYMARSLCFAGRPEEAVALFQEIITAMPEGHAFPFVRLAVAQTQCGDLSAAAENAAESTRNYPEDHYGWFVLANVLEQLGRHDEARQAIAEGKSRIKNLNLETIISQTESTYGRTEDQRKWLTSGLRRMLLQ